MVTNGDEKGWKLNDCVMICVFEMNKQYHIKNLHFLLCETMVIDKEIIECPRCGKKNEVKTIGGQLKIGGKVAPGQRCKYCLVSLG